MNVGKHIRLIGSTKRLGAWNRVCNIAACLRKPEIAMSKRLWFRFNFAIPVEKKNGFGILFFKC